MVEYDDGTDYGGSETYSFEDERYGGGGRRRGGQTSHERTTQRSQYVASNIRIISFGPYSTFTQLQCLNSFAAGKEEFC